MIYFARIEKTGIIKIGTSKNVEQRMASLSYKLRSPITLLGVCDGSFAAEKAIHSMFTEDCAGGEFFVPSLRLMDFIKDLSNFTPPNEREGGMKEVRIIMDDKVHRELKKFAALHKRTIHAQSAMILESYLIAKSSEVPEPKP